MTTGYPDALLEAEARKYGAAFMEKPIRSAELVALIRSLLADAPVRVRERAE